MKYLEWAGGNHDLRILMRTISTERRASLENMVNLLEDSHYATLAPPGRR
jgi:hypothetical protein